MKVFLYTDFETDWARAEWKRIAAVWSGTGYECTSVDSVADADVLLFTLVDTRIPYASAIETLKRLDLWRENRDRSFVFDTSDQPMGYFPGLYTSLRRSWFSASRHRTSCYFQSFNEFIHERPLDPRPPLLFSFQGNATSPVRERLFGMSFNREDVLIERTEAFWANIGAESTKPFKAGYAETMGQSRFVLCPRGNGMSSYRLFETMQSGRVPVIIADSWVPCEFVSWDDCSLRVKESDLARLPELCEANEDRWSAMAQAARREWEQWFSEAGLSRSLSRAVRSIQATRRLAERHYAWEWPVRTSVASARRGLVRAKIRANAFASLVRRGN